MSADLTPDELERRRLRGAIGGLARSAKLTAEQRTESARLAGIASGEARRRRRAEAEGKPVPPPKVSEPMPSLEALEPYLIELDAEGRTLTYEQRIREAVIRHRRDVASAALEAAKRKAGQ